ncbi:MAG: MFS transporter [Candidatus Comchoanobacterales bacterium]
MIETRSKRQYLLLLVTILLVSTIGSIFCDFHLATFNQIALDLNQYGLSTDSAYNLAQLTMPAFLIAYAIGGFLTGPLADQLPKHRLIYTGLTITIVASSLSALSQNLTTLLVCRGFQGLGTAMAAITIRSMFTFLFADSQLKKVSDLFSILAPVLFTITPALGTYIFGQLHSWRALFWLMALYAIAVTLLTIACQRFLPKKPIQCSTPFFKRFAQDTKTILLHPDYLINLSIFCLTMFMVMAILVQMDQLFTIHLDLNKNQFALIQLALGACWFLSAALNQWLLHYMNRSAVVTIGCSISLCSFGLLSLSLVDSTASFLAIFGPLALFNFSMTLIFTNTFLKCIQPFKKESGTANAIMNLCQYSIPGLGTVIVTWFNESQNAPQWPLCLLGIPLMLLTFCISVYSYQRSKKTSFLPS